MISDSLLRGVYLFTDLSAEERTSMARIAEEMSLTAGFRSFAREIRPPRFASSRGSAAYAVAEPFRWRRDLDRKLREGRRFYAIIAFATLAGVALTSCPIDLITALFWSAVISGPVLIVMMLLAGNAESWGSSLPACRSSLSAGWLRW